MKKIGLVTIVDYNNYGNRLQNYAAQQVLESIGCDVTALVNKPTKGIVEKTNINLFEKIKGNSPIELTRKVIHFVNRKKYQQAYREKNKSFKAFTNKNIKESDFTISDESIPEGLDNSFDYFVVGSDQVWNPNYRKGSAIDFLTFAPKNKRVSYAPSFGISEIPDTYKERYSKWLLDFKCLSVRENEGAKIIKDMTDRNATVIVDPTLMLNKDEWLAVSKISELKPKKSYLLTYFLGKQSKEMRDLIYSISKDNNLGIVNLGSYEEVEKYAVDPGEFIDYINSSSIVFTDSFHGAVFSILLEKPFVVFNRLGKEQSMNSRIDTLLSKFKLESRRFEELKLTNQYFTVDFSNTERILSEERNKAYEYLIHALEIQGNE